MTTEKVEVACSADWYHHLEWEIPIAEGLMLVERRPVASCWSRSPGKEERLTVRTLEEAENLGLKPCIACLRVASFEEVQE